MNEKNEKEKIIEEIQNFMNVNKKYDFSMHYQIGEEGLNKFFKAGFYINIVEKDGNIYLYVDIPVENKPYCYFSNSYFKDLQKWISKNMPHKLEKVNKMIMNILGLEL